jgi:Caspase domain/PAN domain
MIKLTAWRSLFIASFVAATATCAAGREGVFPNPRPDRTWGRTAGGIFTSGKSIAVVIGISNYIGTRAGGYPALPTAKRDADKMVDFLLNDAGFDTVYLLTDEDATKVKIDRLMTDVIPAVVTARDRFLFYWSGHGDQRFSGDGRPFGFLPVADSKSKEFSGMVSMQDLERWDRYLDARQALFVLDACLSGLAGFQTKAALNARLEQLSLPARHLITAGTKDEIVISGDRWGGSLFTDSFILGARGQARSPSGIVSLPVLLDFIQERVARERELVNWSKSLTPQIQSLQHGEGYFFFTPIGSVGPAPSAATPQIPEQKGPSAGREREGNVEAEAAARSAVPSFTGLFAMRRNTEVGGGTAASSVLVDSTDACAAVCARDHICKMFTYNKATRVCDTHSSTLRFFSTNEKYDSGTFRPEAENQRPKEEVRLPPSATGLFTITSNTEAIATSIRNGYITQVRAASIPECEQKCVESPACKIFTYDRRLQNCFIYSDADFRPSEKFISGVRK